MIQIDGYEILNPLGVGGMGEVYLANQLVTGRKVALKVLLPQYIDDPELSKQFQREGQIAAGLNHPHIVNVYDVGESDGLPYLAMEYLPAGDLKFMLRSRANLFLVLNAIHQVAGALVYTHGMGVIHGDVKPQNILFQDVGHAVLSDFGTAHEKQEIFSAENVSYAMGSPVYISPEQVLGEQPSHLSDIYSLGVIIFEALAGHPPFLGESPIETARLRLASAEIPKLAEEYADYQGFIDLMLARDPKNRRLELSEFISDFHAVMQGNTVQELEKTQRFSVDEYHEREGSDFFFIAPTNLSEAQDRTQQIPIENTDSSGFEILPEARGEVLLVNRSVDVVTGSDITTTSESLQKKNEPLKEWVTIENDDIELETRGGKLDDLFFFLREVKENLKKTTKTHTQNYPHAEDVEHFLQPVRNEVKRQSFIFAEKLSRQTKLLFTTGLVLVGSGIVSVVASSEKAPQAVQKTPAILEPPQPVPAATQATSSGVESSHALWSSPQDNAAKQLHILAGESDTETATQELDQNVQENPVQDNKPRQQPVSIQKAGTWEAIAATADDNSINSVVDSSDTTELAMLDTISPQREMAESDSPDRHVNETAVKSDLDSGVVTSRGRKTINQELEVVLGRHVDWMIRHKDGSLSLFVDWVDLVNEAAGDDFSDEAKKSLNALSYYIRNYDGFTISISDHSHQQKTTSAARAYKVLAYLRGQGVPPGRMQTLTLLSGVKGNVEMRLIPEHQI